MALELGSEKANMLNNGGQQGAAGRSRAKLQGKEKRKPCVRESRLGLLTSILGREGQRRHTQRDKQINRQTDRDRLGEKKERRVTDTHRDRRTERETEGACSAPRCAAVVRGH